MKTVHILSFILVVVGAINWGLVGLFNMNLVVAILGGSPMLVELTYIVVGAAGVYLLLTHNGDCKTCSKK